MSGHRDTDVVVIGAGIMGLAAAWQLADLDRTVTLLEQFHQSHDLGSSHGGTRGHRYSYEDPAYARMAMEAELWWRVLERRTGASLLSMVGGVDIGVPGTASFDATVATVRELGLDHTLVAAGDAAASDLAPFVLPARSAALLQPGAGLISASRSRAALGASAEESGVTTVERCLVEAVEPVGSDRVEVHARVGEEPRACRANHVVIAAGPWTGELAARSPGLGLPAPFPVNVLACEPVYFAIAEHAVPQRLFYIHPDGEFGDGVYGQSQLVSGDPGILKLGLHGGVPVAVPGGEHPTGGADAERLRNRLIEVIPGARDARAVRSDRCYYSMTPDERFVIDFAPGSARVVVMAGFSGHGFKFAPLLGRLAAELATDGVTQLGGMDMSLLRFAE